MNANKRPRVQPLAWRDRAAASFARTAGYWSRRRGHGGSSLPGLLAERVSPGISGRLAERLDSVTVVSGTNGKTTTTYLLSHILGPTGRAVLTNRSGANLSQSISTTMLDVLARDTAHQPKSAVFECDEFALTGLLAKLRPKVMIMTNLFRDQLDRYAEIDEIERRWAQALAALPETVVVAPADDPRLAWLATHAPGGCVLYGVRAMASGDDDIGLTHDSEDCPRCGNALDYDWHTIGHQGSYRCPACGLSRPEPWLEIEIVESHGFDGQTVRFTQRGAADANELSLALPGISNAYNVAAAVCAAHVLGVDPVDSLQSLAGATNAWGRYETVTIEGRRLILTLGKNPASIAELLRITAASDIDGVLFVMNDDYQDGRDVSWYWDVNPTIVVRDTKTAISGARALDLALRFKYELPERTQTDSLSLPMTFDDPMSALRWLLDTTSAGATVVAIATYTGLLDLRKSLVSRRVLERMPV